MSRKNSEFDFPNDMNNEEIEQFMDSLDRYVVELPDQDEINMTIENLRQYVPVKVKRKYNFKLLKYIKMAADEMGFMSSSYWLINLGIFIFGMFSIIYGQDNQARINNAYITAILLSPAPFILGIFEVFRGREEGVVELELSCKLSIGEVMFSRLMVISVYNIVLNTLLSAFFAYTNSGILFWRITLLWLTPFAVVSAAGLFLVSKIRGSYVLMIFTSVWMIITLSILTERRVVEGILGVNILAYMILTALGIILTALQFRKYAFRNSSYYERSVIIETKS